MVLAGQAVQSLAEWEGSTDRRDSGEEGAPDHDAYVTSVQRLRSVEPVRVLFAHDAAVWQRA